MPQSTPWEKEYQNPKLITMDDKPQKSALAFFKFLKNGEEVKLEGLNILDLGSGTGRNANYLAELGNTVIGFEISPTALSIAKNRSADFGLKIDYRLQDIGSIYPLQDASQDIVLDITSSNALNETERDIYLTEVHRVLKPGGHLFVRTLCLDGDKNVKNLIKQYPGKEKDTYVNQYMKLIERVFSRDDFVSLYSKYFEIQKLEKTTSYTKFNGKSYRRNFWIGYLKKN
jgi:SAM-dependent methyltransferase